MNIYEIEVETIKGKKVSLRDYKEKVILIVNTASKCGFTPQFKDLEKLYQKYKEKGLMILGFPCNQFLHQDPGSNDQILSFCELNYGVTFPMFSKLNVKGKKIHPLYAYLIKNSPVRPLKNVKWNFEKFLINNQGEIVNRYRSRIRPIELFDDIEAIL
jgi:glutathione peroxidase